MSASPAPGTPGAPGRRYEALVADWEAGAAARCAGPAGARLRRLLEQACAHGLHVVLVSAAAPAAVDEVLRARPPGPGMLLLVGRRRTPVLVVDRRGARAAEREDAPRRRPGAAGGAEAHARRLLLDAGVPATQTLVLAGADRPGAGLDAVLADQLRRRRRGDPPLPSGDPAWTLRIDGRDPLLQRVHESLLTIGDGVVGTRGSIVVPDPGDDPGVRLTGVYAGAGADTTLARGPGWGAVAVPGGRGLAVRRELDLRTGVLTQDLVDGERRLRSAQFSSLAAPGTAVLRARARGLPSAGDAPPLSAPAGVAEVTCGSDGAVAWMRAATAPGAVVAAAAQRRRATAAAVSLDRVVCLAGDAAGAADAAPVARAARRAGRAGFERLLDGHRRAWAARWRDADVTVDGDPALQLGLRLALFQLMCAAPTAGEGAIGARGLTGDAYRGHVFWDTDVFVLPFLAATCPAAARTVLEYRVRRLGAARAAAAAQGHRGARFPWESAAGGTDVTPASAIDPLGRRVAIESGPFEEHIVADVAWAAVRYAAWTGDRAFVRGAGAEIVRETARWWASRIVLDHGGRGHIRDVVGPDEYHPRVDDNAYTNVMARWNLRVAAEPRWGALAGERRRWLALAATLVDGLDPATGIYEQFAGFGALEPLRIADLATRPVAADRLLGAERTRAAQVVKQADVLMLHHLVPEAVEPGSLPANLDFYEPRTAHGSTLSPGVHASLMARAGRPDAALDLLRLAARIDLDDIGGTTAGGLHLAAMAGAWAACAAGFCGLQPAGGALAVAPCLPADLDGLTVRVRFRGAHVRVRVTHEGAHVRASRPVTLVLPDGTRARAGRSGRDVPLTTTIGAPG